MRVLVVLLLLLACAAPLRAEEGALSFGGERYVQKYEATNRSGNRIVEFVPPNETLESWTKLVGYHAFPQAGSDPRIATGNLARTVTARNQDASVRVLDKPGAEEAMIDFLISAPNSDVIEYNVFRYVPAVSGPGVVALQFAQRFRRGELDRDEISALRGRALNAAAAFDMSVPRAHFAGTR